MWRLVLWSLVGITIGLTVGLLIAWQWLPLPLIEATPADLGIAYKEDYIRLVAATFADDGDLPAAQTRLRRLHAGNIGQWVADFADRRTQQDSRAAQELANLAVALGIADKGRNLPARSVTPTGAGAEGTGTPTPKNYFAVLSKRLLSCRELDGPPRIRVYVRDEKGAGMAGIRLVITGNGQQETFFTGLKGTDPGYADYDVERKGTYSLAVDVPGSETASDLRAGALVADCPAAGHGEDRPHGWEVVFRRVNQKSK